MSSPVTPPPPLGRYAPSTRGQFAPSLSYLPLFDWTENVNALTKKGNHFLTGRKMLMPSPKKETKDYTS